MKAFIWHIIEIFMIFVIIGGIYLMKLLKRETLIETLDGIKDIVVKLLVGSMLVYFVYAGVIPAMKDIPDLIQKNFYTIEGIAQKDCKPPKFNRMSVHIMDEETKEVLYVTFFYGDLIDKGDRLTVQYLPNLKFGVLIERNGERIRNKIE